MGKRKPTWGAGRLRPPRLFVWLGGAPSSRPHTPERTVYLTDCRVRGIFARSGCARSPRRFVPPMSRSCFNPKHLHRRECGTFTDMSWTFICDRDGRSHLGLRQSLAVPRISVERQGRTPEGASRAAAKEFFASNSRYAQVEMTVEEDSIST